MKTGETDTHARGSLNISVINSSGCNVQPSLKFDEYEEAVVRVILVRHTHLRERRVGFMVDECVSPCQ